MSGPQPHGNLASLGISPEDLPQTPGELHMFWFYFYGTAAGWDKKRCEREAKWAWPLTYYKIHGIKQGMQWDVLGRLACRYARKFSTDQLARELAEVARHSQQDPGDPWRWHQIYGIAERAKRFIEREDAKEAAMYDRFCSWWQAPGAGQ
jgi:hypothetical protein